MEKTAVNLMMVEDLMGLIVELPTGVTWSNWTHGTACRQSHAEGLFLPLDGLPHDPDCLCDLAYALERLKVTRFLVENGLDDDLEVDDDRLKEGGEAWVPVRVRAQPDSLHLQPLAGLRAWVTYTNSDRPFHGEHLTRTCQCGNPHCMRTCHAGPGNTGVDGSAAADVPLR